MVVCCKMVRHLLTAFIPIAGQVGKVGKLSTIGGKTGTIVRGAVAGGGTDLLREDTYTRSKSYC